MTDKQDDDLDSTLWSVVQAQRDHGAAVIAVGLHPHVTAEAQPGDIVVVLRRKDGGRP